MIYYFLSLFFSLACLIIILIQIFFYSDSDIKNFILLVATIGYVINTANLLILKRKL